MRLFLLTALTMLAFAANSLLNRLALAETEIGPGSFAALRVAAGALVLLVLLAVRDRGLPGQWRPDAVAVLGLAAYMLGFSHAYVSMDAGLGALVLFGGVQITMFLGALAGGEAPASSRWAGMGLSMLGLLVLGVPSGQVIVAPAALLLMGVAAIGWGIYSLRGRSSGDPVAATMRNFLWCLPLVALSLWLWPDATPASGRGVALALVSGGVTSGLGYALWYALLPRLGATRGALAQLSVPALALGLAALLLGEAITLRALVSAAMVLGGIGLGLWPRGTAR